MGYNTEFYGQLNINPVLTLEDKEFLKKFSASRHVKRDTKKTIEIFGLGEYGTEGEWFLEVNHESGHTQDVINYNLPPSTQPGLWCDFEPNEDGSAIIWNQSENTYDGLEWITYLVTKYLVPRGYVVNGRFDANGEEHGDFWAIVVENNNVEYRCREIVDKPV